MSTPEELQRYADAIRAEAADCVNPGVGEMLTSLAEGLEELLPETESP